MFCFKCSQLAQDIAVSGMESMDLFGRSETPGRGGGGGKGGIRGRGRGELLTHYETFKHPWSKYVSPEVALAVKPTVL